MSQRVLDHNPVCRTGETKVKANWLFPCLSASMHEVVYEVWDTNTGRTVRYETGWAKERDWVLGLPVREYRGSGLPPSTSGEKNGS